MGTCHGKWANTLLLDLAGWLSKHTFSLITSSTHYFHQIELYTVISYVLEQ